MSATIRPTKKQRELLTFIENFIGEHGYSPSYREIMNGLQYTSVATVALHVNSLISRGHLRKRDRSARSLEVVHTAAQTHEVGEILPGEEKWLVDRVDQHFRLSESAESIFAHELDHLYVLIGALKVLGMDGAAQSFMPRLAALKERAE